MVTKLDEAISELTVIYTKIGKANQEISKRMQSRKFDTYSRNVGILLTKVGNLLGKLKNGKLSAPGELRLIREIITIKPNPGKLKGTPCANIFDLDQTGPMDLKPLP